MAARWLLSKKQRDSWELHNHIPEMVIQLLSYSIVPSE